MSDAKSAKITITKNWAVLISEAGKFPYHEAVGSLLYLSSKTRPDIAYGVSYCSGFMDRPTSQNVNKVKQILLYVKGILQNGTIARTVFDTSILEIYCDSDYAEDPSTTKSKTNFIVFYCGR